jgi:hypothetical protein
MREWSFQPGGVIDSHLRECPTNLNAPLTPLHFETSFASKRKPKVPNSRKNEKGSPKAANWDALD